MKLFNKFNRKLDKEIPKNTLIFLTIIAVIFCAIYVNAISTSQNKIYWSFDSAQRNLTNVFDQSGSLNPGAIVNGSFRAALIDQGYFINSTNQSIRTNDTDGYSHTSTFTVSFWINKTTRATDVINVFTLDNQRVANDFGFLVRTDSADNFDVCAIKTGGVTTCTTTILIGNNTWHHFVGVYNGSTGSNLLFYVNGTLKQTATFSEVATNPTNNQMIIGNPDTDRTINVTYDEFSLWNRTLTPSEILELYNSGNGFNPYNTINLTILAIDLKDNSFILNFNATINGTNYTSNVSNGVLTSGIPANLTSAVNLTVIANGFYDQPVYNLIPNNLQTGILTVNLTALNPRHLITAINASNSASILNFNIIDNLGFSKATSNGSLLYTGTWNLTTNATINSTGFESKTNSFNNTVENNFQFILRTANTFNFTIYDEILNVPITWKNITVAIIAPDIYEQNITTQNGTAAFNLVTPAFYRISYRDINNVTYFERNYYTTLQEGSFQQIRLYLLNQTYVNVFSSDGELIQVIDNANNKLDGAIINVNKYFLSSNSFETVERLSTNFEGKTLSRLTSDGFYRFVIEYPEGTTVYSSSSTQILEEPLTFIVSLIADASASFFTSNGLDYTLTFSNSTNQFIYTFNDPNLLGSNKCLKVYQVTNAREILFDSSCSTSQSGTLFSTISGNYTFIAKAFATIQGNEILIDTISYVIGVIDSFGQEGIFWLMFLTLIVAATGIWNPVVALLLLPLPTLLFSALDIVPISTPIGVSITLVCWIFAFVVARRS